MMDKSKLVAKHLNGNHFLISGSVKNYLKTGEVTGVFRGVLIEMLQEGQELSEKCPKCCNTEIVKSRRREYTYYCSNCITDYN
jgi:hypothetical protein